MPRHHGPRWRGTPEPLRESARHQSDLLPRKRRHAPARGIGETISEAALTLSLVALASAGA
jgi:hypothetical protein